MNCGFHLRNYAWSTKTILVSYPAPSNSREEKSLFCYLSVIMLPNVLMLQKFWGLVPESFIEILINNLNYLILVYLMGLNQTIKKYKWIKQFFDKLRYSKVCINIGSYWNSLIKININLSLFNYFKQKYKRSTGK